MESWNEFGDFLAGLFLPLPFMACSRIHPAAEGTTAKHRCLETRADELKNSVDQYKEMVSIAREQLLADASLIEENKKLEKLKRSQMSV